MQVQNIKSFKQGNAGLNVIKYSSDGLYCFSGGNDKVIRLWNPSKVKDNLIFEFHGHGWEVLDLDCSKDSSNLVSSGGDRSVFLWDIESTNILRKYSGHSHKVNCVAFNEDASVIASGSFDTTVRLWDCRSRSHLPIQILEEGKDSILSVKIMKHEILVGSVDSKIRLYDIRMGKLFTDTVPASVTHADFTKDGNCILVSSLDNTIRLLDKSDGNLLNHYDKHQNQNYKIISTTDHDDSLVLTGSEDNRILIYDLLTGDELVSLEYHKRTVTCIATHPKSNQFLACSTDAYISVWEY